MSAPESHVRGGPQPSALLTDLYELTMAAAYFDAGFREGASFELFVRSLPRQRSFLVAAGLEQALDYLEGLRFQPQEIEYLRRHPAFGRVSPEFFEYLAKLRFTGEVWAVAEGTPVFAMEPLLRVIAPIIEAQIVETFLLSVLTFQTSVASKAARIAEAAQGRPVVEFGTRRAHGPEAGVLAARAAYLGGCAGTSNVEAGFRFGIPTYGTLAHSFVMAFEDEERSFREFERVFPQHATLLLDTYDTLQAVETIIRAGLRPAGVRLDSGDLGKLSRQVRRRLDEAGLRETKIFASGDLDEFAIREVLARGAPVDAFGVGTELATSRDAPALGGVYKLVEVRAGKEPHYRAKFSEDKFTYPGSKQVFRFRGAQGGYEYDLIARAEEKYAGAEPLLNCVMRGGARSGASPPLDELQQRARRELAALPARFHRLRGAAQYPVRVSPRLRELLEEVRREVMGAQKEAAGRKGS